MQALPGFRRFPLVVKMKQVDADSLSGAPFAYSRFFSAFPAPVPLYFDGVTLKR
jgi:hypothetical protein